MTSDEVMRLPSSEELVLMQGERPYRLKKLNYLMDVDLDGPWEHSPIRKAATNRKNHDR